MKSVEQDLYDLLSNGPDLAGITVSYGESFLEDEASELVNILVASCQLSEDQVSGDITEFKQLVGTYSISIFITAATYLRANEILNLVGDTMIQQPSEQAYYFEAYEIDADNSINVLIELSVSVKTNFVNRA